MEDWASFLALWEKFKASEAGGEIAGDEASMRAFFSASLVSPTVGFLLLIEEQAVKGFAIVTEGAVTSPVAGGGVAVVVHGFVRAIHLTPGTLLRQSLAMEKALCDWGRARIYPFLTGHCSKDYLQRAEKPYTRLGWHKSYTVVYKNLV